MKEIIRHITTQLATVYPLDEAEALAWWMMEEMTGLSRTQLQFGCKVTTNISNVQEIIDRLLHFEPIQYIFGHTVWNGLDLKVTPATLIPRPETAELVEQIINHKFKTVNPPVRILDIGTGSGCIAIALKKAHPEWQVTGIDISAEAIEVAKENAARNGVEVEFKVADIFNFQFSSSDSYGIVVSNPPYICNKEKAQMRPNVLDYEPHTALFVPDEDPLLFYRRIADLFAKEPSSFLFFEINEAYAADLSAMLGEKNYTDIQVTNDIYGKPRIIQARTAQ